MINKTLFAISFLTLFMSFNANRAEDGNKQRVIAGLSEDQQNTETKAETSAEMPSYHGKNYAQIIVKRRSQKDVSKVSIFQLFKDDLV
ncbi:hypothetical protein OAB56_00830 [Gammaproteobacteria bacterium]|jgi:hypothetical protein|nr:hypothetical protein [Gammaproteobacteria bacterium]|tara:strand:+ start:565 stop:828 length:264 start_codon:yes stop_codon:yes gene_type:complete